MSAPKVRRLEIPEGSRGTEMTLAAMRDAVTGSEGAHNAEVRHLAQKIVEGLPPKAYEQEVRAIYDFMRANVRYTLDPRGLEWVQTPWYTLLVSGMGDCDDHATAIAGLAISLGHGAGFRTVKGDPGRPDDWSHVYPVIGIRENGVPRWIPLDTTEVRNPRFGEDPPGANRVPMKTWVIAPA
jgi:transglutaminase-like putative cysteine protease